MTKTAILCAILAAFLIVICCCGKKGPIEPPIIKTPQKVETWDCFQRGDKIICQWINPATTVDGSPLRGIGEVEIWILRQEVLPGTASAPLNPEDMKKQGKLASRIRKDELEPLAGERRPEGVLYSLAIDLPKDPAPPLSFVLAVRVKDEKKRASEFSEFKTVLPQTSPLPPAALSVVVYEDRIEVRWKAPETAAEVSPQAKALGFNVYRQDNQVRLLNSLPVKDQKFDDREFAFGRRYRYFVRSTATETPPYFESGDSDSVEVSPQDIFPPRPPGGIQPVAGSGFISMSWEAGREKDLAGYKVWRREETEKDYLLLTPEPVIENTFTDSSVAKNRRYYYAIYALDKSGNESDKTQVLVDSLKDRRP